MYQNENYYKHRFLKDIFTRVQTSEFIDHFLNSMVDSIWMVNSRGAQKASERLC